MKTSTTLTPLSLLPAAIDAVTEAGRMLRAEFHRAGGPRGSAGTAPIDREVETVLKTRLMALLPCGWKGEETASVKSTTNACWIVDPNDGTSDFLKGLRGSAISVALLESNRLVLGIVHAPTAPDDGGDLIAWAEGGVLTRNGVPVERTELSGMSVIALNAAAPDYALHNHTAFAGLRIRALPSPAYRLAAAMKLMGDED
jgi:ADP-ribosyl-[dinitrogen reductase] hydrolase